MLIALSLVGGLAFFLFGLNIVGRSLTSLSGIGLRNLVLIFTRNRFYSSAIGFAIAVLLQSSSAMSVLLVGLADSGALHLSAAIPLLLGANIGATITVQLIAFDLSEIALFLIALGFFTRSLSRDETAKAVGEVVLGFGLVFYGMGVMSMHGAEMAKSPVVSNFLHYMNGHPVITVIASALFTALLQASAATIGLAITMVGIGLISFETAMYVVAGANIGTVATAIITSFAANYRGKRVAAAHLILRLIGATIFIVFMPYFVKASGYGSVGAARAIANANTLFALVLFIVAIPFTEQLRFLVHKIFPTTVYKMKPLLEAKYLEKKFLTYPAIALNHSWKEICRIAHYLEGMMDDIGKLITEDDLGLVRHVRRHEAYVDSLVRQTVSYLVQISREHVPDAESRHLVDQLFILDNLESISDCLKRAGRQSAKRINAAISFSEEGARELREVHSKIASLLTRLDAALRDRDTDAISEIHKEADKIEKSEEDLKLSHFHRLFEGRTTSEASTRIHMEILNQLTEVNGYIRAITQRLHPEGANPLPNYEEEYIPDIVE